MPPRTRASTRHMSQAGSGGPATVSLAAGFVALLFAATGAHAQPLPGGTTPAATEPTAAPTGATLTLQVTGLRNDTGQVLVRLYVGGKGFPGSPSSDVLRSARVPVRQRFSALTWEGLPPRRYAVSVCHDEDKDNACDTNFLGIPKEGVGASNNPKPRLGAPSFDAAAFDLPASGGSLIVTVRYL